MTYKCPTCGKQATPVIEVVEVRCYEPAKHRKRRIMRPVKRKEHTT